MCFHVDGIYKTRAKAQDAAKKFLIAKRNITVYKVLEMHKGFPNTIEYISPYKISSYNTGEIKSVEKFTFRYVDVCGWRAEINRGLHSYSHNRACSIFEKHDKFLKKYKRILVKCKIPKNTPYYKNEAGEYVSLKLEMPKKFINEWENN